MAVTVDGFASETYLDLGGGALDLPTEEPPSMASSGPLNERPVVLYTTSEGKVRGELSTSPLIFGKRLRSYAMEDEQHTSFVPSVIDPAV